MALKHTVDSLDGINEALHGEYTEKDGKFILNVEGMAPQSKLNEFRETNIARGRELDELKARYADVDVDKYRELTAQEVKIKERKLIDAGKVDELLEARIAPMRADHDKVVKSWEAKATSATKQLEGLLIDSALRDAAMKGGVSPTASTDVLNRGRQVFRLHEGKGVAFEGQDQIYGKDGSALTMGEWVTSLSESAPHLFVASQGAGSKGSQPAPVAGGNMTRATFDKLDPTAKREALKTHKLVD